MSRPQGTAVVAHAALKSHGMSWGMKLVAALFAVFLFVGTAGACVYVDLHSRVQNAVLDTSSFQTGDDYELEADPFSGRAVNLLVIGVDSRTDQDENIVGGSGDDETMRSDTTLLMHISADRSEVTVVSIPRDLLTTIPSCVAADGSQTSESYGQFNWAFQYGAQTDNIAAGVACTQATTELLTGLTIDGFVVIDFTGFTELMEIVGTVEICVEEAVSDSHSGLELEAGCQELDPYQALAYARARYSLGDGSDVSRIGRQQELLGAMVQEILGANLLTDLSQLYSFVRGVLDTIYVSSSLADIGELVSLANSLSSIDTSNIRFVTMPTTTAASDPNRLEAYEPYASALWSALQNDTVLPAGIVYTDLDNNEFTMGDDGEPQEGADLIAYGVGRYVSSTEESTGTSEDSYSGSDTSGYGYGYGGNG